MELKLFVVESLVQIAEGIREAQNIGTGAHFGAPTATHDAHGQTTARDGLAVSFDIAVSVTRDDKNPEAEKLVVHNCAKGGQHESGLAASSRISFTVPVSWPEAKLQSKRENSQRPGTGIADLDISL